MKKILKKIVFFGTDEFSLTALKKLVDSGYNIALVVTKPDSMRGRGHKVSQPAVKEFAQKNNINVLQPDKILDIKSQISNLIQPVGILASYGKIIPSSVIDLFEPGIINIHPSLLPKYRGPSPIESTITNGDKETGVTIMKLVAKMDAGPIYAQSSYKLAGNETRQNLYETLAELGSVLLINSLQEIVSGNTKPTDQDEKAATYCRLLNKEDSKLRPDLYSAEELERQVRAYIGFPRTKTEISGYEIIITKARVSSNKDSALDIACKGGKFLSVDELITPSGKLVNTRDFINGYSVEG